MTAAAPARLPLPATLDDVDADWLSRALRQQAPGATVRRADIGEVIHGTCTKVRLTLDLNDEGLDAGIPTHVILKTGFEPHSPELPFMHEAEVRAYRDVLPVLGLRSPSCHYADFDPVTGRGAVIMADLSARGVAFCHPLAPEAPEAVAHRLRSLAAFHARTWDSAALEPGGTWDWVPVMVPAGGGHMAQFLEPATWRSFVELPRGRAASVRFQDRDWMAGALAKLAGLGARRPHAVLHGDTHLGNLYVDTDGTPGFFDSLPHRWPALAEIAYHIGGALDPFERRASERALLRTYLDALRDHGVPAPPLDQAERDYAAYLAFGFLVFVTNSPAFQSEAINTAYTARFSVAMIDNDTIGQLDELEEHASAGGEG